MVSTCGRRVMCHFCQVSLVATSSDRRLMTALLMPVRFDNHLADNWQQAQQVVEILELIRT